MKQREWRCVCDHHLQVCTRAPTLIALQIWLCSKSDCAPSCSDYHLYYAGDSAGIAYLLDSRTSSTTTVDLQASVNTLCVPLANVLITGDSKGSINVFDIRKLGEPTYSALVSPSRQPLSNIICSGTLSTPLPERVLSANGFDNVLRVYELESALSGSGSDGLVPAYSFTGFRNKNWPIKASIYQGKDCMLITN